MIHRRACLTGTSDRHVPFTVDQRRSLELLKEVPTMAGLTRRALGKLEHDTHFILQVDGAPGAEVVNPYWIA